MSVQLNDLPEAGSPHANTLLSSGARVRVCHLSMTLKTGGLERLLVDFARFHDATRYDLSFVALDDLGPPAEDLRAAGYPVSSIGLRHCGKRAALRKLREHLSAEKIDVLHTHNTYPQFYGSIAGRLAGVPVIINTQHGRGCGPGWKSLWQFRMANRLTDRIIGVSEDAARLCRQQSPGAASKIQCIWNGIDVDRFRYSGPSHEPVAIGVGRLSPEKDYSTLLRATAIVLREFPQFRLRLVGDGAERPRLERLATDLKIADHVEFLGERQDVHELLRTAGFFVSSSKTEGISLTLLEAMAVGLPIVTTRVGGNPEIVVEGETGRLVPPLNPDGLAAGILEMLSERELWSGMGIAARSRIEQHFDVRRMLTNYEALYLELLSKKCALPR
ncbi:glycosyltransferase [Planctomicrobium sp. SH664]|uniref:glycosyltransferase n=1 Tax=Planctomicrobium sp. SH664 TaxID=3448125 RepID=UPI003F5B4EB9